MSLLEQPLLILFIGTLAVGAAAVVWVQTQHRFAAGIGIVAALLTLGGLAVERWVKTPGEQIRQTVDAVADQLIRNDVQGVLGFIDPNADAVAREVEWAMGRVRIERISIKRNFRVTLGQRRPGRTAEARFNAVATLSGIPHHEGEMVLPRFVVLRLRLRPEGWRIHDYDLLDPRGDRTPGDLTP